MQNILHNLKKNKKDKFSNHNNRSAVYKRLFHFIKSSDEGAFIIAKFNVNKKRIRKYQKFIINSQDYFLSIKKFHII